MSKIENFNQLVDMEYIKLKIKDYKIVDYTDKLKDMIQRLDSIIRSKAFMDEMSRFISIDIQERTLKMNKFIDFLIAEDVALLQEVDKRLGTPAS